MQPIVPWPVPARVLQAPSVTPRLSLHIPSPMELRSPLLMQQPLCGSAPHFTVMNAPQLYVGL